MLRKSSVSVALVVLAASLVSGCIFFPSAKDKALRKTPSFKEGYSDGCAAATLPEKASGSACAAR